MAEQSLEEKMKQLLTCSICLQRLRHPKTLSCEHSFCQRCLQLIFRKSKGQLVCPSCRTKQDQITQLTDIACLHTGLHLRQTMDVFSEDLKEKESSDEDATNFDEADTVDDDDDNIDKKLKQKVEIPELEKLSLNKKSVNKKVDKNTFHDLDGACSNHTETDDDYESEIEEDLDDDLKKKVREVSDNESDDNVCSANPIAWPKKSKKHHLKKKIFKRISKSLFKNHIVHDLMEESPRKYKVTSNETPLSENKKTAPEKSIPIEREEERGTGKIKPDDKQEVKEAEKILSCSYCKEQGHDTKECKELVKLRRAERQIAYTGSLAGVSYATRAKLSASALSKLKTGAVGYNAGGLRTKRNVTSKKVRNSSSSRSQGRSRGNKRGFLVVF
ncbi:E3 ubiquitin-protein ligase RNF168-like [Hydractinia symbiolongicarpus]|uniref:E3 ubiquitin-protein ligase RNF168-like n=1 Tax=Hydractinia symbiolongicarpus TaxID=13093 RepID=UPI00254CAD81|nr:E3 ubiquitin-protein ligase RNF168-like [Hydractinia symbiolongicarpus]XP_057304232.1 E3 ubiquitin-protein ligase RNF168-like [Hydractinia symbiolongicarpus]